MLQVVGEVAIVVPALVFKLWCDKAEPYVQGLPGQAAVLGVQRVPCLAPSSAHPSALRCSLSLRTLEQCLDV